MNQPLYPPPPFRYVYQDESGDVARSIFIVGLLLVRDADKLRAAVQTVRAELTYANELHFCKMSALRERVYCATFEVLAGVAAEFEFSAIVVRREFLELSWFGGERHLAYNFFTKHLLQRHAAGIAEATIFSHAKTRIREDNFLTYLRCELNLTAGRQVITRAHTVDSKTDDVLQVADLFTGCANVLASGLHAGRKKAVCDEAQRLGVFNPAAVWEWHP